MLSAGVYQTDDTKYLALKIMAPPVQERVPFHLVLVLDVSGSMEGERLDSVKRTVECLIQSMRYSDSLSIITYSSDAHVIVNNVLMNENGRNTLLAALTSLHADGGTNMESALFALRQIQNFDAVFLLTDGQVNQGVASRTGLLRIFHSVVPSGIPVNTLGYGEDHNYMLLRDMSAHTCGSYTYADREELIPAIIGDIVGGLENTFSKRAQVFIPEGWTCEEIGIVENNKYNIGSLISEKPQWVLFQADQNTPLPNEINVYYAGQNGQERCSVREYRDHSDVVVAIQRDRCIVAKALLRASESMERRSPLEARDQLIQAQNILEHSIAANEPLVISMRANIDDMLSRIPATQQHFFPQPALLTRLVSGTAVLGNQRGFYISSRSTETITDPIPLQATFSSPLQQRTTHEMTSRYSQMT